MITKRFKHLLVLSTAALAASCTVSSTPAPPLMGPSEMSLSLTISANPDVLSMDGSSQTLVTVEARDSNGQPAANVPLRIEILADGQAIDFGTLSARTLVTNSSGRATFTYTAPPTVGGTIPKLDITVTPTGSGDASSHLRRTINIRLVPPGVILPGGLTATFTFSPDPPQAYADVLFNASNSRAPVGGAIVSYAWNFGDGSTGSGATVAHRFGPGTFTVTLTTTDSNGFTASSSQILTVAAGVGPSAVFVFSPAAPLVGQDVFFNAGQSTAAPGRRIVSYRWNFGDGTTGSGVTRTKQYPPPANPAVPTTYVVVLTVTDDVGQVGTASGPVIVCPAIGCTAE